LFDTAIRRINFVKQDKQDRRSRRTRRLVDDAMTELLREKRYDAITVQDLLDRAGIGRSTFYAHYFDKEDVLTSVVEQQLEMLRQLVSTDDHDLASAGQNIVPSLAFFRHIEENYHFFRSMLQGHTVELLLETGQALLSRNIEQALISAYGKTHSPQIPLSVVAHYLAGAFASLLKWWLEAEMPYTPEQMDAMFQQLALPGVMATLR
jgi:AcrR family transcriptional regulator